MYLKNISGSIFFLILTSCSTFKENDKILAELRRKFSKSTDISYEFTKETNNIFNSTTYADSGKVAYIKNKEGMYGFSLYAKQNQVEYFFDGHHFEKYKHQDGVKIIYDDEEIRIDSNYFLSVPFYENNPINILNNNRLVEYESRNLKDKKYLLYRKEHREPSKSDSTKTVLYEKMYFIDKKSKEVVRIIDHTILEDDTLQIVEWRFKNHQYGKFNPEVATRLKSLDYKPKLAENEFEELENTPVYAGQRISHQIYKDINGNDLKIYGADEKWSLILFSFIGCAPCEMAIRDLKMADNKLNSSVNIFYSSFQNTGAAVKKYFDKKGISFNAFGSESNLMEDFGLYHSPSFVIMDIDGKILLVKEGYDVAVKEELFKFIQSKNKDD